MCLYTKETIKCPHCVQNESCDDAPSLSCSIHNYSGYSVDIAHCPVCGSAYQISYKVDEVYRLGTEWDKPTVAEKEKQRQKDIADTIRQKEREIQKLQKQINERIS